MNPLNNYPQARAALYFVQWLVNGVVTLAGAYFLVAQTPLDALPEWYVYTIALAPVLWTYLGITAQSNTPTTPTTDFYDENNEVVYGAQPPLWQDGSDEQGFGGDAPVPGPENGSESR